MANDLSPGFIRIDYHRSQFPHAMILPTRAPQVTGSPPYSTVQYEAWDSTTRDIDVYIDALVLKLKALFTTATQIDSYTAFSKAVGDPAVFLFTDIIAVAGTVTVDASLQTAATQSSYSFLDAAGGKGKLVLMERQLDVFTKKTGYGELSSEEKDVVDILMGDAFPFQSRKGYQLTTFRNGTFTLNEKLRRSERLS